MSVGRWWLFVSGLFLWAASLWFMDARVATNERNQGEIMANFVNHLRITNEVVKKQTILLETQIVILKHLNASTGKEDDEKQAKQRP